MKIIFSLFFVLFSFQSFSQNIYEINPDVSNCEEGKLTDSEKEKVLNYVNRIRQSHKLPPVTYDNSGDVFAQKGALVTVANRALSHTPPSNWKCFSQDAYYGNENSNLFIYLTSGASQISSELGIINWMIDESVENLGHRRAIINPFVDKISFGRVEGNVGGMNVTGMNLKYLDNLDANIINSNIEYVAYPQGDYDKDYFQNGWYLSFHVIRDKVNWWNNNSIDYTATTISVKDSKGNQVGVNSISYDNEGWGGLPNMIKWKCSTLNYYETYSVEIKNVKFNGNFKDYSYTFILGDGPTGDIITPSLINPSSNASDIPLTQVFSWSKDESNYVYNIQISETENFSTIVDQSQNQIENTFTSSKLKNETTYFWRVQAVQEGAKSAWSEIRTFTTEKYSPIVPKIISPENQEFTERIKPIFIWENVNENYTYDLLVGDRPTFSLKIVDEEKLSSSSFNSIYNNLKPNTKYYWKVRSNDDGLVGEWTETYEFTTPPLPEAAVLISPTEEDILDVSKEWTFKWSNVENATEYEIRFYTGTQKDDLKDSISFVVSDTSFTVEAENHELQWYLWSVATFNSEIFGKRSEVSTANWAIIDGVKEINFNQINIYPNPAINTINLRIEDESFLNSNYHIYDNIGNKINEGFISSLNFQINLETYSTGSYIIILENNNQKYYSKFIKK